MASAYIGVDSFPIVNLPSNRADYLSMLMSRNRPKILLAVIPLSLMAFAMSLTIKEPIQAATQISEAEMRIPVESGVPPVAPLDTNTVLVTTAPAPKIVKTERGNTYAMKNQNPILEEFDDENVDGMNWKRVEKRIKRVLRAQSRTRVGLVVKDLGNGYEFTHNADRQFASASLVKIPIAVSLFRDIEEGKIDRNLHPLFEERHRIGGSGILRRRRSGERYELDELLYLMLAKSDNTATNILTGLVGMDRVTEVCRNYGWTKTDMVREVMALHLRKKGVENWTSPRDMAAIFEGLYRGEVVSPRASGDILNYMLNPPISDRLPRKIPRSVDVIHKTGLINDNAHDVGILYLPGDNVVLVAALVDNIGSQYRRAKNVISEIAKIVYEEAAAAEKRRKSGASV